MDAKTKRWIGVVCAAIGIGAAGSLIYALTRPPAHARHKAMEAQQNLQAIYKGAETYFNLDDRRRFPTPTAGPTPPLGSCCKHGGECPGDPALWAGSPWSALEFHIDGPHYYSYRYTVNDNPGYDDGTNNFTVQALGDLDCDGIYSTFTLTGASDASFGSGVSSSGTISEQQPQE